MDTLDYLVEMKINPVTSLPSPQDGIAFTERYVLPTLQACAGLQRDGKLAAGGLAAGGTTFSLLVRATSHQAVDEMLGALPIWSRAQTTVIPLTSFEARESLVRKKLAVAKASLAPREAENR